jgi:molybdenum cofactor cytidylyltransferase
MSNKNTLVEVMVLAAGASRRLGQPKQLLPFRGTTLIKHVVKQAIVAGIGGVNVVLGCCAAEISSQLADIEAYIFFNEGWQEGMGSSIRNGLGDVLRRNPNTNGVMILVVDQPFVSAAHLRSLAARYREGQATIVASAYENTFGVPILVGEVRFDRLLGLKGDEGGKKIFSPFSPKVARVPFPGGSLDIDTEEDLATLR